MTVYTIFFPLHLSSDVLWQKRIQWYSKDQVSTNLAKTLCRAQKTLHSSMSVTRVGGNQVNFQLSNYVKCDNNSLVARLNDPFILKIKSCLKRLSKISVPSASFCFQRLLHRRRRQLRVEPAHAQAGNWQLKQQERRLNSNWVSCLPATWACKQVGNKEAKQRWQRPNSDHRYLTAGVRWMKTSISASLSSTWKSRVCRHHARGQEQQRGPWSPAAGKLVGETAVNLRPLVNGRPHCLNWKLQWERCALLRDVWMKDIHSSRTREEGDTLWKETQFSCDGRKSDDFLSLYNSAAV